MEEQKEHKRRVRYKGTHPRNYNEKYKELNPEKYQGTIEHVIQKGSTPAGMHIPILFQPAFRDFFIYRIYQRRRKVRRYRHAMCFCAPMNCFRRKMNRSRF